MTRREMIRALLMGAGGLVLSDRLAPAASAVATYGEEAPLNVLLGRPTAESVTLSIMARGDREARVLWGAAPGPLTQETGPLRLAAGEVTEVVLRPLQPDTACSWALKAGDESLMAGRFYTQRAPGAEFTFTITADSHLGTLKHCDPLLYARTMHNAAVDRPDFHVDLGDTFRATKPVSYTHLTLPTN